MTFAATAGLGAIAGGTIFLGLPVGRARNVSVRTKVALSMLSAGILPCVFMDVGSEALGIIEIRLDAFKDGHASLWPVIGLFALLSAGFLAGGGGIASVQGRAQRGARGQGRLAPRRSPRIAGGESAAVMTAAELREHERAFGGEALRTGMVIAAAIG